MDPLSHSARRAAVSLVSSLLVSLAFPISSRAVDGELDPSFSGDGKVTSDFGNPFRNDTANDMVIQPDGKIVVGGGTRDGGDLARYNPDGSLDTTFGGDGSGARSGVAGPAIALQSDGKIVIVGSDSNIGTGIDVAFARFNADGSLDDGSPSDSTPGDVFGIGGRMTADFGGNENGTGIAVQSDGKIVVVGYQGQASSGNNVDFVMARYNANGSLDDGSASDSTPGDSFGTAGKVITDFASEEDIPRDVVIQSDGKIVVAGSREFMGNPAFAVARYLPTGALDPSFDGDGRLNTGFNGDSFANAVVLQSNGKIIAAGAVLFGVGGSNFALVRYNANGSLDTSFGVNANGRAFVDIVPNGEDQASDLALQTDGRIVVGGHQGNFSNNTATFAVARFLANGTLDNSFGTGGTVATDFGATPGDFSAGINAVAVQTDGNIVAAGATQDNQFNSSDVVLARYLATSVLPRILHVKSFTLIGTIPTLTIDSETGYSYKLQVAPSLEPNAFTTVGAAQQGNTGTTLTFTGPAISEPSGFYRILIESTPAAAILPAQNRAEERAIHRPTKPPRKATRGAAFRSKRVEE
jgi:uncharacterized delta-60 repeat protein